MDATLAEWLNNAEDQNASIERSTTFAKRWLKHPLFTDLVSSLDGEEGQTVDGILAIAQRFVASTNDISHMIDDLIVEAAKDPFFRPPFGLQASEISKGYVLYDNHQLCILINIISADAVAAKKLLHRGEGTVSFTGFVTLYHYLKSGDATLSLWNAPAINDSFSAPENAVLTVKERRRVADGDSWVMDGRHQSFIIEHADSDIVQLQALVKIDAAPLAVEYDIKTGVFAGASATDDLSSRIQMMVTLLRLMERDDAVPIIESLLANPHFFVRWHLMREFLAMNADAAFPHLKAMASHDPHPEVRDAAAQTLHLFFSGKEI
ncbi:HEAT repeat domain-containing protein [Allosphingosinicella flava]|uniref:HEAT repeat domain-containing protein n=2 Tax=Allosphingosinicella flava TaxID=2771430 RepID=A0A7T2GK28_9SPHN|nr:HEAT repeat domain-containing protein [Sphingosinicella flava]